MNRPLSFLFGLITLLTFLHPSFAASDSKTKSKSSTSYEVNGDISYVGSAKTRIGDVQLGDVTETSASLQAVQSREIGEGNLLRIGAGWQRFSFGLPNAAPLPNTLQSVYGSLGADIDLPDSWLLRVETYPGIYSDFTDVSGDDFNSPLIIGASYLASEDLQWVLGLSVNFRRDMPVLPGAGVRWKFAEQWTLNFILPKPRLEYEYNDNLMFYAGGEIKSDTYTVSEKFGSNHGRGTVLDNAELDYTEGRIGAGASLKVNKAITVSIEGGAMVYRDFDFHEANQSMHEDSMAAYGQLALKAGF